MTETYISYDSVTERVKGSSRLLTTMILLLWEVPNHLILETLTSTDKLLCHVCSMGKVYKIFESQPHLAGQMTCTEKSLKLKRYTVLVIENSAMTSYIHVFIHYKCTVVFLFFVITARLNYVRFAKKSEVYLLSFEF